MLATGVQVLEYQGIHFFLDDVDIWSVVDWRYYGLITAPAHRQDGNRARMYQRAIDRARANGKREILGRHGLFSANAAGVKLACLVGCNIKGPNPDAWPQWSHDSTTAGRIEAARADTLRLASS